MTEGAKIDKALCDTVRPPGVTEDNRTGEKRGHQDGPINFSGHSIKRTVNKFE